MSETADKARDILLVIDMQNDFIGGQLAAPEAEAIMPHALDRIRTFDGEIVFTMDTHDASYPDTNEGAHLPISHCVKGSWGWELDSRIKALTDGAIVLEKPTFGSLELGQLLRRLDQEKPIRQVTLIGLVTDICVLSNALIAKAALPFAEIGVDARATAGTSAEAKATALEALAGVHVLIQR